MKNQENHNLPAALLLPVISALLLILSFPPFNLGFLAWISLIPLLFYCRGAGRGRRAFLGGLLTGLIFFLYLFSYMALSVNFLFAPYLGVLVVVFTSLMSSLYFAFFALAFAWFLRWNRPLPTALAAASLWVLLEYLRAWGLLGHSGGFLGYSQAAYYFLLPLVSVYGYWGMPFLMVLFQAALVSLFARKRDNNYPPAPARRNALPLFCVQ